MSNPLYLNVEKSEHKGHAPNRSFLRGELWFRCLPDEGKADCAAGQAALWLVGTGVSQEFLNGVAEAASEWEAETRVGYRQPAAGYDPAVG